MCIQLQKYSVAEGQSLSYISRMKSIGSSLGNLKRPMVSSHTYILLTFDVIISYTYLCI